MKIVFLPYFLVHGTIPKKFSRTFPTPSLLHLWLLPLDYCDRFQNIANVCLTNECSRHTLENPALRNLGLLPFYIPVIHIFPYLLLASNPPAKHPPYWNLERGTAKHCGFVWQPSAMWQRSPTNNFFFPTRKKRKLAAAFVFNSWVRASIPRVIAGTRICRWVTRSLVVDGFVINRVRTRVRRPIVSEETRTSVWWD